MYFVHFTFISTAFLLTFSTVSSFPTSPPSLERNDRARPFLQLFTQATPPPSSTQRPLQQFFKKILSALRPTTTTPKPTRITTEREEPSPYLEQVEVQKIPNFVDFSTFLLGSFAANNSAINFSYMQPNSTQKLRGNYSVISFLVPHEENNNGSQNKGIFSFLSAFRLPWNRDPSNKPSNTNYSQFPPFLERFTQRIQSYFSVYKYSDDSRKNNTIVVLTNLNDEPENHNFTEYGEGLEITSTTDFNIESLETTSDNQLETTDETIYIETLATSLEAESH